MSTTSRGDQIDGVLHAVEAYFHTMHHGDGAGLRRICHPGLQLIGWFEGELIQQSLDDWITEVDSVNPAAVGEPFDMGLLSLEFWGGEQFATARVCNLVAGVRYEDVLTFAEQDKQWLIVSKTFTETGRVHFPDHK